MRTHRCVLLTLWAILSPLRSHADVITDGTVGRAQVLKGPDFSITDDLGTKKGGNLFHSFQTFGLKSGETALFTGPSGLQNVISRVTGGTPSSINGTIRSEIAGANFWMINPNGILFGEGAKIDVPAAFHVSTADHLRFSDSALFSATHPTASTLTTAPIAAFGFLQAKPARLEINGSVLQAKEGQHISLVAGDITMQNATVQAPAGHINLISVGSAGEALPTDLGIDLQSFTHFGDLRITRDVTIPNLTIGDVTVGDIDTSGESGGAILVRAQNGYLENVLVFSDTYGSKGGIGIDASFEEGLTLKNSSFTSDVIGDHTGGHVYVNVGGAFSAVDGAQIHTSAFGPGNAADVMINAGAISLQNGASISASSFGSGNAGSVKIRTKAALIDGQGKFTGISSGAEPGSTGMGGDVNITVDEKLTMQNGGYIHASTFGAGNGGSVVIQAHDVVIDWKDAQQFTGIASTTEEGSSGAGGDIHLNVSGLLLLQDGGTISAITFGAGNAGNIRIRAKNMILDGTGSPLLTRVTGGVANTSTGAHGADVEVNVDENLSLLGGGFIASGTQSTGHGGNITISAGEQVTIAGNNALGEHSSISVASRQPKTGGNATGLAGTLNFTSHQLEITDGGRMVGTSDKSSGGNLIIKADHIRLINDAHISTSVAGDAETVGGNVTIQAENMVALHGSSITAKAKKGKGGSIIIGADLLLHNAKSTGDLLNASSEVSGNDGSVENNAPTPELAGVLLAPNRRYTDLNKMRQDLCARRRGQKPSTLMRVGRGALPADNRPDITVSLAGGDWVPPPEPHKPLAARTEGDEDCHL